MEAAKATVAMPRTTEENNIAGERTQVEMKRQRDSKGNKRSLKGKKSTTGEKYEHTSSLKLCFKDLLLSATLMD